MNKETLQLLSISELQHYRQTLIKRISDLKSFNIELGKENVELAAKLNQTRIQAHKKNLNTNNFDFDDLYRAGKEKAYQFASTGKDKIKSGFKYAGSLVKRKVMHESEVDQNADFNSYDLTPSKNYNQTQNRSYNPTEQQPEEHEVQIPKRKPIFKDKIQREMTLEKDDEETQKEQEEYEIKPIKESQTPEQKIEPQERHQVKKEEKVEKEEKEEERKEEANEKKEENQKEVEKVQNSPKDEDEKKSGEKGENGKGQPLNSQK